MDLTDLKCQAIAKAKTKETEEKLFDLYESCYLFLNKLNTEPNLSEAAKDLYSSELFRISHEIQEIENNSELCRSKEEFEAVYDEIIYDLEHNKDNQVWYNIIQEFGEDSQEATVAQDMIELQDSVKPAEMMYQKAERDMNDLIKEIQSAREQGAFIINLDNEMVKNITKELSKDQIADIVARNPLIQEDKGLKDLVEKSFDLSEILTKEDINIKNIIAAEKSQHPISFALAAITSIPSELRQARDIAKNAGLDYKNSMEKIVDVAADKATAFYSGAKHATLEQLQSIAEATASIYKESCDTFAELVENAKTTTRSAIASIVKFSDKVLDSVTLGAWSICCEEIESFANDKTIRENGGIGVNTTEGRILAAMQKDPNGFISNLECETFYNDKSNNSFYNKVINTYEKTRENICFSLMKMRTWALSGNKEYDATTYWKEINDTLYGDTKNPADALKDLAQSIDEKALALDNTMGEKISDFKSDVKKKCENASSIMKSCKESAISVIKSIPEKTKALADQAVEKATVALSEVKRDVLKITASIVGRSVDLLTKSERKTKAQISSLENFDKNVQGKIQDIKKEINDLSSITPYVRKPYEMTESIKIAIDSLKEGPPTAEARYVIKSMEDRSKRYALQHNMKENIIGTIHDLKEKASNFIKSDWAKTKLDACIVEEKGLSLQMKQIESKLNMITGLKNTLANIQQNLAQDDIERD